MFLLVTQRALLLFFVFLTIFGFHIQAHAQAAQVPANLAAWHAGDGDTRDFTGVNDATVIYSDTRFIVGKVGQALSFNSGISSSGGGVQIGTPGIFRGQTEGTIETWVRLRELPVGIYGFSAIWVETEYNRSIRFGILYNRNGQLAAYSNFSGVAAITPVAVPQNEWLHVAAVHRAGEPLRLFVNGALAATSAQVGTPFNDAPSPMVSIGTLITLVGDDFYLNGDVDDASVYTRALSPGEIQSIYNAGTNGKARLVQTGAGAHVASVVRDATVIFTNVSTAGETSQTPLEPALLPALPQGYAQTGLAYDLSTTAVYSGDVDLCFNLPALADTNFSRLKILHLENGIWIDRTTAANSPQLCGRVPGLSPFVIAEYLAPTAASVTIGGRITAGNQGVFRARIKLTDSSGASRYTTTNHFGYYRFSDVPAGATYVLSVGAKGCVFDPSTRILAVTEDLYDTDFTALVNEEYSDSDSIDSDFTGTRRDRARPRSVR